MFKVIFMIFVLIKNKFKFLGCLFFVIQLKYNILYLENIDSDPEYTKSEMSEMQIGFIIAMIMHIGMVGSTLFIVIFNVTTCFLASYFFLPAEYSNTLI